MILLSCRLLHISCFLIRFVLLSLARSLVMMYAWINVLVSLRFILPYVIQCVTWIGKSVSTFSHYLLAAFNCAAWHICSFRLTHLYIHWLVYWKIISSLHSTRVSSIMFCSVLLCGHCAALLHPSAHPSLSLSLSSSSVQISPENRVASMNREETFIWLKNKTIDRKNKKKKRRSLLLRQVRRWPRCSRHVNQWSIVNMKR